MKYNFKNVDYEFLEPLEEKEFKLIKNVHKSIDEVTKSIENFHFNIAIASVRTLFNKINSFEIKSARDMTFIK